MKKNTLLVLSLAAMAMGLAACGNSGEHTTGHSVPTGDTSVPASDTSVSAGDASTPAGDTSASAGDASDSVGEESAPSGDESASAGEQSGGASTSSGEQRPTDWPEEVKEFMAEYFDGYVFPFYDLGDYDVEIDLDDMSVSLEGEYLDEDLSGLALFLEDNGFQVGFDEEDPYLLSGDYYTEDYSDAYIYVSLSDGTFSAYIAYYPSLTEWPAENISAVFEETGVTEIPAFTADYYLFYVAYDSFGVPYATVEGYGNVSMATKSDYAAMLEGDGWEVDDSFDQYGYGIYADKGDIELNFDYDDYSECFTVYASNVGEDVPGDDDSSEEIDPQGDWSDTPIVDNTLTFDFTDETQLWQKDGNLSVWAGSDVTFSVSKGNSETTVGNTSYFSNPLRLYSGQAINIAATEHTIESVEFYVKTGTKSSVEKLTTSTVTVGTFAAEGDVATLSGVSSDEVAITLDGSGKQVHLEKVVITFAE